jgi:hypothetical protein
MIGLGLRHRAPTVGSPLQPREAPRPLLRRKHLLDERNTVAAPSALKLGTMRGGGCKPAGGLAVDEAGDWRRIARPNRWRLGGIWTGGTTLLPHGRGCPWRAWQRQVTRRRRRTTRLSAALAWVMLRLSRPSSRRGSTAAIASPGRFSSTMRTRRTQLRTRRGGVAPAAEAPRFVGLRRLAQPDRRERGADGPAASGPAARGPGRIANTGRGPPAWHEQAPDPNMRTEIDDVADDDAIGRVSAAVQARPGSPQRS